MNSEIFCSVVMRVNISWYLQTLQCYRLGWVKRYLRSYCHSRRYSCRMSSLINFKAFLILVRAMRFSNDYGISFLALCLYSDVIAGIASGRSYNYYKLTYPWLRLHCDVEVLLRNTNPLFSMRSVEFRRLVSAIPRPSTMSSF